MLTARRLAHALGLPSTARLGIRPAPLELHVQALVGNQVIGDHARSADRFSIWLAIGDDGVLTLTHQGMATCAAC